MSLPIYFPITENDTTENAKMERPQHDCLPTLNADVDTLKRELEQMYQNVKATCGERREQATSTSSVGMVIKRK